ncbi:hypothetical protein GGR54DRAFT_644719 [Hypoxylon sp. NC1633]|nr:hypothetical protein GGR54DRAFT_644719 [Hypoxylon sp. NC1633]
MGSFNIRDSDESSAIEFSAGIWVAIIFSGLFLPFLAIAGLICTRLSMRPRPKKREEDRDLELGSIAQSSTDTVPTKDAESEGRKSEGRKSESRKSKAPSEQDIGIAT